ncbi:uncharacterized protein LOC125200276 [Salvia hispanica]|uniref:uncharacterized protein LOC125200276 n=1 Tax=Salvia hispanica TaxID=49212 RepID=UPI0020099E63|nr:uncharacterized protein LOC125200276 [Salvia hispanica]
MFDEYLQCGETTGNECLKNFCQGVREIFGEHYLRSPDAALTARFLLDWHWRTHGFPGMLGSIDCMHWQWEELPNRVARPVHYRLQRRSRCPLGDRRRYFARAQESARKDVERAFGVLQSRFALVKGPTRFFYQGDIADIMYACIIMHNMIIDDEHEGVLDVTNDPSVASSSHGVSTESARQGVPHNEHERFQAFMDIHQKEAHQALQHDIIEELWARECGMRPHTGVPLRFSGISLGRSQENFRPTPEDCQFGDAPGRRVQGFKEDRLYALGVGRTPTLGKAYTTGYKSKNPRNPRGP